MKAALSGGFFCFSVGFRSQNRLATSQLRQCGVDAGQPVFRVAILDIVDDLGSSRSVCKTFLDSQRPSAVDFDDLEFFDPFRLSTIREVIFHTLVSAKK